MRGGRVLVVGASGRVGGAAVRHLMASGFETRALVRNLEKGEKAHALGAEPVVGDVTKPGTLASAVEGCEGVFSALATATEKEAKEVEYRGNVNLLSAARDAGVSRFVYSSALLVDHPLAQEVATFREKARFEKVLFAESGVSSTILRPVMFMETMLMASSGPVAFVPGRQRRIVSWICADDVARAAVRAFERDVTGRHELAGTDFATFDEAYRRLSAVRSRKIFVLHAPLSTMRLAGRFSPPVEELAAMFALFDAEGYASDSPALRETFGIDPVGIEEWARRVFEPGSFG